MQLQVVYIGRVSGTESGTGTATATGPVSVLQRNYRYRYNYRNERMVHNVELTLRLVTVDRMILSGIMSTKNMRHIWTEMNLLYILLKACLKVAVAVVVIVIIVIVVVVIYTNVIS